MLLTHHSREGECRTSEHFLTCCYIVTLLNPSLWRIGRVCPLNTSQPINTYKVKRVFSRHFLICLWRKVRGGPQNTSQSVSWRKGRAGHLNTSQPASMEIWMSRYSEQFSTWLYGEREEMVIWTFLNPHIQRKGRAGPLSTSQRFTANIRSLITSQPITE